jgi:soluble cytochrome b562
MKWKSLIGAIVLALLLIWPSDTAGQDDTSQLDTSLAQTDGVNIADLNDFLDEIRDVVEAGYLREGHGRARTDSAWRKMRPPSARRWNKDSELKRWRHGIERRDEFLKKIGVTDEQMERIKELRTQLREDITDLRKTYHENFLDTLNKKQRKALEHKRLERNVLRANIAESANTTIGPSSWGRVKKDTE